MNDGKNCIMCGTKVPRIGGEFPNNYDGGVDVLFHAHYGSKHDMCMLTGAETTKLVHSVICDGCFEKVIENE